MTALVRRLLIACEGGLAAAALVAAVEAREALSAAPTASTLDVTLADFSVLAPIAMMVALVVAAVHLYFEPDEPRSPAELVAAIREEPVLTRSRTAAVVPLGVVLGFVATVVLAHVARALLARGDPRAVGLELAGVGAGLVFAGALVVLALVSPLRRGLAAGADRSPRLIDPITTGGVALGLVVLAFAFGVISGDSGGDGSTPLAIFGVLRRPELDLRPVFDAATFAACGYLFPIALGRGRRVGRAVALAALAIAGSIGWTAHEASALNRAPMVIRALEQAPLGRIALHLARRATDRDHDGASPLFGGGDCDDHDPRRNPLAYDIPGNGIDEDCSGADTPLPPPPPAPPPPPTAKVAHDLNLVLVTIDTLRLDVGFEGYDKPTTPNLDKLAERGVVFDRMYSMASYTGKSVGPLLIGKYPSETDRDGGHFNKYSPKNVFVTERLHDAHIRTFGGASHWYFSPWSGLSQGMDQWDMSAKPSDGQGESDTSVTSAQLSDVALRMLEKPENTSGRFFMWLHYFDPHAEYMAHDGAPDFLGSARGGAAGYRALYDGEVWFTDKHLGRVLDYIASQPWGEHTAIIVTSDHGEAFGEHNMSWHGMELWECLVRVPFIVYLPGATPHHVDVKRSHVDLAPTILDIMGVAQPEPGELSGQSMIRDVVEQGPYAERDVYIDMPVGPYTLMRKALIVGPTPGTKLIYSGGKSYQLYDLATDPDEKNDLSGDEARLAPMKEAFEAQRARTKEIEVKPDEP